jgi:predicted PurR-regulated permease PerM
VHSLFYQRTFQLLTVAILGYALWRILEPLFGVIGWAAVLAFILYPLQVRLTRRLKGRRALAAATLTVLTPFFVFVPLSVLGVVFAGQVARLIEYLRGHAFLSYGDVLERASHVPLIGNAVAWVRDNASVSVSEVQGWMTDSVQALLKSAAAMGGNIALGLFGTLVGFFMMLFMLFFFLQDGRQIITGIERLIPVERERRRALMKYLGEVTRAVVFGSAATALIQGVFVGVGFAIVRLPSPVVFGVLTTIAAFLPAGASLIPIPFVLYLAFTAHWGAAIFLALWTAAVSVLDNVLRPLLTAHQAEVSTLAVFVGAIGGVSAFGILGLILGPVLLSFVVALVRFAQEGLPADA